MRPLATVEKPAFRQLVRGLNSSVNVMCRKTLSKRLNVKLALTQEKVKQKLQKAAFICTTADIWSVNNKSYLGMTAHYIAMPSEDSESVSRESVTLACRRFWGSHTYDTVAEKIASIHSQYELSVDKISATVTDNASNFGKAFREYFAEISATVPSNIVTTTTIENEADLEEESELNDSVSEVDVANVGEILTSEHADTENEIVLPSHETCVSHSLNLLATNDANKACNFDSVFKRTYRAGLAKCTAIWNATHRSSKASDAVKQITDKAILSPVPTRWNSQFDSINRLLELTDKLNDICDALKLTRLKKDELKCLQEYILIMTPLATALDLLQGDNVYYGNVVPALYTLQVKLEAFQTRQLTFARPFASALLASLKARFAKELELGMDNAKKIIAAISHPFFKLRWIPADKRPVCREMFINAVMAETESVHVLTEAPDNVSRTVSEEAFFVFDDVPNIETSVQQECTSYLNDSDTSLKMLNKYMTVRSVFVKFNTTVPSSAPVERLFSTAGLIQTPRRNCLSDTMFEKLLLLKTNGD